MKLRPVEAVDSLSIFTPALLEVTGAHAEDVVSLIAQAKKDRDLSDIKHLEVFDEQIEQLGLIGGELPWSQLVHSLHISLGGLVRITRKVKKMEHSEKKTAGSMIIAVAPNMLEWSKVLAYEMPTEPSADGPYCIARIMSPAEREEHVRDHQAAYVALRPLMQKSQIPYLILEH